MGPGGRMGGPPPMMGGRPPMPPGRRHTDHAPGGPGGTRKQAPVEELYAEDFDLAQMEAECNEMMQMNYLTQKNASFSKTAGDFLTLEWNHKTYENIELIRTFPFTKPDLFLSVRESFGKRKEIGIIQDLRRDFDKQTVQLIQQQLELSYYMPVIEKIIQIKEEYGYVHFVVGTNHGEVTFSLQSNGSHFSYLTETRILITDLEGNRYEIPDTRKLTAKELKKLDLYM